MKKFLAISMILAVFTAAATGCSQNQSNTGNGNNEPDNTVTGGAVSTFDADDIITEESSAPDNGAETAGAPSDGGYVEGLAVEMAQAVYDSVEFPSMMDMNYEPDIISSFLGIDVADCEDYYFANAMINVNLNEVMIAKPKAGREDALKAAFDSHFAYIKDGAAFYPQQEVSAAGAVDGVLDNGYYYIIVHENGSYALDGLKAWLSGDPLPDKLPMGDHGGEAPEGVLDGGFGGLAIELPTGAGDILVG